MVEQGAEQRVLHPQEEEGQKSLKQAKLKPAADSERDWAD